MRIMGVSGSLRTGSSNTELLRAAAIVAPPRVDVVLYEGIGSLPHFRPDLEEEHGLPSSVVDWRSRVESADAVLICSPEYAAGIPGSLKNALDWLVGCLAIYGKATAVLNASPGSVHADQALRLVLSMLSVQLIDAASIALPLKGQRLDARGIAASRDLAEPLRAAVQALSTAATVRSV